MCNVPCQICGDSDECDLYKKNPCLNCVYGSKKMFLDENISDDSFELIDMDINNFPDAECNK